MGQNRQKIGEPCLLMPSTSSGRMRDAWLDQTWGGYRSTQVLAQDLKPGPHRVRIELLEEKNPGSDGHEFRLLGLGAAGVDGH